MGRKSNAQLAAEKVLRDAANQNAADLLINSELDEEGTDDADEIRALSELDGSGDVRWNIHRTMPAAGAGWVGVLSTGELSLERIAQEFGVGKYRVKGSRPNGTIAGQRTITIAQVPKSLQAQTVAPATAAPSGIADYISLMEAKDKERHANMLQWAAIIGPIATALLPSLFGNKGPTLAEMTTTLTNLKALNGGSDSQLGRIEELAKLIEAVQGIAPGNDKGSTWADIARDGVKALGDALPMLAAARIPGMTPPPQIAAPVEQVQAQPMPARDAAVAQPKQVQTPMMQLLAWLKEQLAALTHQASLNKDPNLYADVVLDNLPQVDPTMLRNMLAGDNWWATLVQFSPGVQPYPQWFAECREALLKGLDELIAPVQPSGTDE